MTELVLWGYALAALAFALAAITVVRRGGTGVPAATLLIALAVSTLWALAVAGIDARDVAARVALSARDIAWLGFMYALVRRDRAGGWALASVYAVIALVAVASATIAVVETAAARPEHQLALASTRLLFRMMTALSALVLLTHLRGAVASPSRGAIRLAAAALGLLWSTDLVTATIAYVTAPSPLLDTIRGIAAIAVATLVGTAAGRGGDWELALSRRATMQTLSAVALILYLSLTTVLTSVAAAIGGPHVRLIQTAIVAGASVALLTLLSTPWLRAWARVKVAKHFFRHRYDYREAWASFTATLAEAGNDAPPLAERIARAMAGLIEAPAALTLVTADDELIAGGSWQCPAEFDGDTAALAGYLAATGRIVSLAGAATDASGEAPPMPSGLMAGEAWAIAPLFHHDRLVGAVVLGSPPDGRTPDWEDFDMLRVAGRQAASHLAELAAAASLAEARRFEEFNRRFAFIMHDLKNMVSQLTLVARNAERHAGNPEFRADMVATLNEGASRMTGLIARLDQRSVAAPEPAVPTDLVALVTRIAARRRAQHPVSIVGTAADAMAQPLRLECAIEHLVQNAIEASDAGVPVVVALSSTADAASIEVIDHGRGMSAAFVRDELFRPFASAKQGGFGLGAHEARALVEVMGGTLSVDSREGEGTRFCITLPAAATREAAA